MVHRYGAVGGVAVALAVAIAAAVICFRPKRPRRPQWQPVRAEGGDGDEEEAAVEKGKKKRAKRREQGGLTMKNGSNGGGDGEEGEQLLLQCNGGDDEGARSEQACCAMVVKTEARGMPVKFVWRSQQREARVALAQFKTVDALLVELAERGSRLLGVPLRAAELQVVYKVPRRNVMRRVPLTRRTKMRELKHAEGLLVTELEVDNAQQQEAEQQEESSPIWNGDRHTHDYESGRGASANDASSASDRRSAKPSRLDLDVE